MGKSKLKRIAGFKSISMLIILLVVIAFFYVMNRNYLGEDNVRGILHSISITGIIAVGMACLLIGGQVDLAAGAEGCLAGVLVSIMINAGIYWPIAILLAVLCGAAMGLITSFLVNVVNFMAFISTIALASIYEGFVKVLTNNQTISISDQSFWLVGSLVIYGIPLPFIIMAALFIIYGVILSYTRFGRSIYMCGGNVHAARLAGINPKKIRTILFVNCGAISALAGVVITGRMHSSAPSNVIGTQFDAITGAVLGGVSFGGGAGSMFGCFLGLLVLGCFNNGLIVINLESYWQTVARGVLLIVAITVDTFRERARLRALKASNQVAMA